MAPGASRTLDSNRAAELSASPKNVTLSPCLWKYASSRRGIHRLAFAVWTTLFTDRTRSILQAQVTLGRCWRGGLSVVTEAGETTATGGRNAQSQDRAGGGPRCRAGRWSGIRCERRSCIRRHKNLSQYLVRPRRHGLRRSDRLGLLPVGRVLGRQPVRLTAAICRAGGRTGGGHIALRTVG